MPDESANASEIAAHTEGNDNEMITTLQMFNTDLPSLQQEALWLMIDTDSDYLVSGMRKKGSDNIEAAVWLRLDQETIKGFQNYLQNRGRDFLCEPQNFSDGRQICGIDHTTFNMIWPKLDALISQDMTPTEAIKAMIAVKDN